MVVVHDPACVEYEVAGHPESPARVGRTLRHLRDQIELAVQWAAPVEVPQEALLRAHSAGHLKRLERVEDFDADTPWFPGLPEHARRAVGGGLAALEHALAGRRAFSLMRPPGHHATREQAMGFCYLSSAAIVALSAQAAGRKRVAVFDFDVHHGNGTEDILMGREGVSFYSVHQYPAYPGTGVRSQGNCRNYPVAPHTSAAACMEVIQEAWEDLMAEGPDLVVVSAGFDAYRGDPLAEQQLEEADFRRIGKMIHAAGVPAAAILEGGYSRDLPELILAFLVGWEDG
jgi:acetoin utilization deacetylase AcuC-like enzyme